MTPAGTQASGVGPEPQELPGGALPVETWSADDAEAGPGSARRAFPCRQCGAGMRWDPAAYALTCSYCSSRLEVPRGEGTIVERPLEDAATAERGLGLETRGARCPNCGARVAWEGRETSKNCVYCGRATVLELESQRNAIRPESLIPLERGQSEVSTAFRAWRKRLWFRPSALQHVDHIAATGIYVPFWTFDSNVFTRWSAEAGHYYYVNVQVRVRTGNGYRMETRRQQRVRWVPAWGTRHDSYDDLLVNASEGLPEALVAELGGFDTTKLLPYRPEYLAGWAAEEYARDLDASWLNAQRRIEEIQRGRCSGDVPGDTQRNLQVQNAISDVRWKHVLLPIWSLQYRFRGKVYTVLVNGQTGKVVGQAPYSAVKIGALVLVIAALVLAFVFLKR